MKISDEAAAEELVESAQAKARMDGEAVIAAAKEAAAKEVEAMKAVAAEKEELAIQGVIAELIP